MAAPIRDAKLQYVRDVYTAFLTDPNGFLEESGQIDTDAIKDLLGVPKADTTAQAGDVQPEPEGPPTPGVDDRDPLAATIRRVYANLGIDSGGNGDGNTTTSGAAAG